MPARILQTTFITKQYAILEGIDTRQISAVNKVKALDSALMRYSQDFPRASVSDFAGNSGKYYVLSGSVVNVDNAYVDTEIDITSSGSDQQLAIAFTLPRRMQVLAARVLLKRTGSPAGTIGAQIRLPGGTLPSALSAATSNSLTSASDLPVSQLQGKSEFTFATPVTLEAGTYFLALVPSGYTYSNGVTEIVLGVDQNTPVPNDGLSIEISDLAFLLENDSELLLEDGAEPGAVLNTLYTYNGTIWSPYATASAGVIEIIACLPNWDQEWSDLKGTDLPAPTITSNGEPQDLEAEDFSIYRVGETQYLYLPNHAPASGDTVRLNYTSRYVFSGSPLATDVPAAHFEAVAHLGAYYVCHWLSVKYGQNIDGGLNADMIDRRNQSDVYASRAKELLAQYQALVGLGDGSGNVNGAGTSAMYIGDVDRGTYSPRDFLHHPRRKR